MTNKLCSVQCVIQTIKQHKAHSTDCIEGICHLISASSTTQNSSQLKGVVKGHKIIINNMAVIIDELCYSMPHVVALANMVVFRGRSRHGQTRCPPSTE